LVTTTVLVNEGCARYAWVTLAPLAFLGTTTLAGGALPIRDIFLPLTASARPADVFKGWLNSGLTAVMMASVLLILADAIPRWDGTGEAAPRRGPRSRQFRGRPEAASLA
jgi:carbon starvation protein